MKPQALLILVAFAIAAAAAAWVVTQGNQEQGITTARGPVLPDLAERINDVASVTVTHSEDSFTLAREGEGWVSTDRGGYPAQDQEVRKALIALADLQELEPRTSDPALFDRLDVAAPDAEDSASVRLDLAAADGSTLGSVLLGKDGPELGAATRSVYIRRPDAEQAWLASGNIALQRDIQFWLVRDIASIRAERITEIELYDADGATHRFTRPTYDQTDITVENVPEGAEVSSDTVANSVAWGLEYLELRDVMPAPADLSETRKIAFYRTFDGIAVDVRVFEREGESWLIYEPRYVDPEPALPDSAFTDETEEFKRLRQPDEARAEIEAIKQRVSGWAYRIPDSKFSYYTKTLADMLKKDGDS